MRVDKKIALYARVSSSQQVEKGTIKSQVAGLQARIESDGFKVSKEMLFLDDGYSGSTLIRPALEKLRNVIDFNVIDCLYVQSPGRLARKYAYQVLLVDEFQRSGIQIVFLNKELGGSPEDNLLLQVQGVVAEYERAKILERSRRGKLHAARSGDVSVLSKAPFGYRYVTKKDGAGQAAYKIESFEASVVRKLFNWVGNERLSIGAAARRLEEAQVLSPTGRTVWDRSTIWGMLKNPAYKGKAMYGKTRQIPMQPRLRALRGSSLQPRRARTLVRTTSEEQIEIPVPKIVDEEVFELVTEQLEENRIRKRQNKSKYLLQGLVVCAHCQYAYTGKTSSKSRRYGYYVCCGSDSSRFSGKAVCDNLSVRTDKLDEAVWNKVCSVLKEPKRVEKEFERRLKATEKADSPESGVLKSQLSKLRKGKDRLIDSYAEGHIEKDEFVPRIKRLKKRVKSLEEQEKKLQEAGELESELRLIITKIEEFSEQVRQGLDDADWETRQEIIRAVIKEIEIGKDEINVIFRIEPSSFNPRPQESVQLCWGRVYVDRSRMKS